MKRYTTSVAVAALLLAGSVTANAQDTQQAQAVPAEATVGAPTDTEEVIVTGSRIRRTDVESISPMSVLSEEDLENSGNVTIEDFLQDMPAVSGGDFGSTVNNGNPGLATVSLRGLGPNRTLVLLNGRRLPPVGTDGIIDLNVIPSSIIERVEVLRDGASTIYGSDAIGGVVNIITKRDFEGGSVDLGYDLTGKGDGDQYNVALTLGKSFEEGHFTLNAQYSRRDTIWQRDRNYSRCPFDEDASGNIVCSGSGVVDPSRFFPTVSNALSGDLIVDSVTDQVRDFDFLGGDAFNFAAVSYMVTPQEVFSIYGSGRYDILSGDRFSTVSASLDVLFANRESDQLLAAEGTFWAPTVPASNPHNPFGTAQCGSDPLCTSGGEDVIIVRRLTETGGRGFNQDVDNWQIVVGLDGEFRNGWRWDLSYSYGDFVSNERNTNRGNTRRFDILLDPVQCAADAECAAATANSGGAWDPFHSGTLSPAMQDYALVSPNDTIKAQLSIVQLNFSGDSESLGFSLPGGPIGFAMGVEYRKEVSGTFPDGATLLGEVFNVQGGVTAGDYSTYEEYAEISLPILADKPFAHLLTVEGSFRHFNYSTVGSGTTYSAKVEWAPVEDARFRYAYNTGFRAPNIGELFLAQQETAASYSEPCEAWDTLYAPGSAQYVNCGTNDNLPAGFVLSSSNQALSLQGGNPDLFQEESTSHTVGVVVTPRWLEQLSMTVDYFRIEITDAIGAAGVDVVVGECYASLNFSSPLCSLLVGPTLVNETPSLQAPARRNVLNQISGVNLTNENLAQFNTSGLDLGLEYSFETPIGDVTLNWAATWLNTYEYVPLPGFAPTVLTGRYGTDPYQADVPASFPEWQFNTGIQLSRDNWGVVWSTEYMSSATGLDTTLNDFTAGSVWYNNLSAYYQWERITLRLGARNLGDVNPPYVTDYDDMNTIQFSYETAGRYFYGRLSYDF